MCVRTWGRDPRTCVMPPCTGRLRPPVSCPSPARPLDSRGGKPSIGMPPTSENGRLHGQSVCRTPVLQPISFGERPFPCTAASETAFSWPAPTEIRVPTYVRTYVHTYEFHACSLGATLRPGGCRGRRRQRQNHGRRGRIVLRFRRQHE